MLATQRWPLSVGHLALATQRWPLRVGHSALATLRWPLSSAHLCFGERVLCGRYLPTPLLDSYFSETPLRI